MKADKEATVESSDRREETLSVGLCFPGASTSHIWLGKLIIMSIVSSAEQRQHPLLWPHPVLVGTAGDEQHRM